MYTTLISAIMSRGTKFLERVYGKVADKVMGQMDWSGTEDLGLLARLDYGFVLSPCGILPEKETSFGESVGFLVVAVFRLSWVSWLSLLSLWDFRRCEGKCITLRYSMRPLL
jgi:hypothetical protein